MMSGVATMVSSNTVIRLYAAFAKKLRALTMVIAILQAIIINCAS